MPSDLILSRLKPLINQELNPNELDDVCAGITKSQPYLPYAYWGTFCRDPVLFYRTEKPVYIVFCDLIKECGEDESVLKVTDIIKF